VKTSLVELSSSFTSLWVMRISGGPGRVLVDVADPHVEGAPVVAT